MSDMQKHGNNGMPQLVVFSFIFLLWRLFAIWQKKSKEDL
jgi:hypothetical protein